MVTNLATLVATGLLMEGFTVTILYVAVTDFAQCQQLMHRDGRSSDAK
jgi:hypothetical protein